MGGKVTSRAELFTVPENSGALTKLKKDPTDMSETIKFKLIEKKQISPDTYVFSFEIPNDLILGINVCQHISIDATIEGNEVSRKYTPISCVKTKGRVDVLVKVYFKNVHPNFPNGGVMSQHLYGLSLGDEVEFRGPFGKLVYLGDGNFEKKAKKTAEVKNYKHLACLAGGTGITPIYQIIQSIALNNDKTKVTLLFGNRSSKDILLKEELDSLVESKKLDLTVAYTLDKAEEDWKGEVGYLNKDMINKFLPGIVGDDVFVLTCGPPLMCESLKKIAIGLGVKEDNFHDF